MLDVASALGVVYARHQSRNLSTTLGVLEADRDRSMAEWSRLQLEQSYLADTGSIEGRARNELGMDTPEATKILVVKRD